MSTIIGRKIRQLRLDQDKKLKDLSLATDLSVSYLSKIEREDFTVSAPVLEKIAAALGVTPEYFQDDIFVTRSYERQFRYYPEEMLSVESLSVHPDRRTVAATIVNVLPGNERMAPKPHSHKGEEFVYVMEGTLTVMLDGKATDFYPGDCLHFSSEHTHRWLNRTNQVARFLVVNTYPNKWEGYMDNLAPLLDPGDYQSVD